MDYFFSQLSGLNLLADEEDLAIKYLATLQALAVSTICQTCSRFLHRILLIGKSNKNKIRVHFDRAVGMDGIRVANS